MVLQYGIWHLDSPLSRNQGQINSEKALNAQHQLALRAAALLLQRVKLRT